MGVYAFDESISPAATSAAVLKARFGLADLKTVPVGSSGIRGVPDTFTFFLYAEDARHREAVKAAVVARWGHVEA